MAKRLGLASTALSYLNNTAYSLTVGKQERIGLLARTGRLCPWRMPYAVLTEILCAKFINDCILPGIDHLSAHLAAPEVQVSS